MKIIALVTVLIAAFKTDARHFSDQPSGQEVEELALSDYQHITFGPENTDYIGELQSDHDNVPELSATTNDNEPDSELLRGKSGKKNLQKLIKSFEFLKYNLTQDNLKIKLQLQSINKELKMDLDSLMDNITNGNIQLRNDLQSIHDHQKNITDTDEELKVELLNIVKNISNSNSELKTDVNSIKSGLNSNSPKILSELGSISSSNFRMKEDVNSIKSGLNSSNQKILSELGSISSSNFRMKTDVNSIKSSIDSYIPKILSVLESIAASLECPEGFISLYGQCYKYFSDTKRNWESAGGKCKTEGLQLAKPKAALLLRSYIVSKYGMDNHVWLEARGDGSSMTWQRDWVKISQTDPLWARGHPSSKVTSSYCLGLFVDSHYPTTPYVSWSCSTTIYTLCELVRG